MNVSAYTQASSANYQWMRSTSSRKQGLFGMNAEPSRTMRQTSFSDAAAFFERSSGTEEEAKSQEMRALLRNLQQASEQNENPYVATSENKVNGFLELSGSPDSKKNEKIQTTYKYNYRQVAVKIQQAKTSVSAGQAVLAAKRKVVEVRRKIAGGSGDAEDLQLALTHAKRMEMVARKKKHHLELEEMVTATRERDERLEQMEEAATDWKNAMVDVEEQELTEQEDAIFDERQEMIESAAEEMKERGLEASDEMMAELNDMIAEFGEEELEKLEEQMEQLENLEMVDPHMSEEELEDLKRKHRNAEERAIVKANMEYLKGVIKHAAEKGGSMTRFGGGSLQPSVSAVVGGPAAGIAAAPSAEQVSVVDVSV